MKELNEFRHIGKEMPYKTPPGFFETVSESTLQKAILREKAHKKDNLRRLIFSVAASLALLLYLGFHFVGNKVAYSDSILIAQDSMPIAKQIHHEKMEIPTAKSGLSTKKLNSGKISEKRLAVSAKNEALSDVLSDLSDDELQQIAAMYTADPFINESVQ